MGALWNSQADKVVCPFRKSRIFIGTVIMIVLKVVVTTYKVVTVLETTHNYEAKEARKRAAGTLEDHNHLIESKAPQSQGKDEDSEDEKGPSEKKQHKKKSHTDGERHEKKKKSKKKKRKHKDKG